MLTLTQDPQNPDRLVVTETVTLYLDKLLLETLSQELRLAIQEQARKDLKSSPAVRKLIARAATDKLLLMLGAEPTNAL